MSFILLLTRTRLLDICQDVTLCYLQSKRFSRYIWIISLLLSLAPYTSNKKFKNVKHCLKKLVLWLWYLIFWDIWRWSKNQNRYWNRLSIFILFDIYLKFHAENLTCKKQRSDAFERLMEIYWILNTFKLSIKNFIQKSSPLHVVWMKCRFSSLKPFTF